MVNEMEKDFAFINALDRISGLIMKYKIESINSLNADISISHFIYIEKIHKLEQPTFSEIAATLDVTRPAVTAAINNLIQTGYVEKIQMDDDKRMYRVRLTTKGEDVINAYNAAHEKFIHHVKSILNEQEYLELIDLITRV